MRLRKNHDPKKSCENLERHIERMNFLREIGFSDDFVKENHSTKAAIAIDYLNNAIEPFGSKSPWKELYYAIEANIENNGKAYRAWIRDELSDYDFVNCVLVSYRRHTETNYDDLLREFRQMGFSSEEAREMAREQKRDWGLERQKRGE